MTVRSTESSAKFYRDLLGMTIAIVVGVIAFAGLPALTELEIGRTNHIGPDGRMQAKGSNDNFYADRATRAAEVYRQDLAPVVVASGRRLRPYANIAEFMTHDLIERGVPKDRIIPFPQDADCTKDEAEALHKLVQDKNWKRLIIVTSNYHTRRARYIVGKVFDDGITVRVASARDGDFDPANWYEHRRAVKRFAHEAAGYLLALWELRGANR